MICWDKVADRVIGVFEETEVVLLRRCLDDLRTSLAGWLRNDWSEWTTPTESGYERAGGYIDPSLQAVLLYHADEWGNDVEGAVLMSLYAAVKHVLSTLPHQGGLVELTEVEVRSWLRALTDVRIAMALSAFDADEPRRTLRWMSRVGNDLRDAAGAGSQPVSPNLVRSINRLSW